MSPPADRLRVAVLGATGVVGQRLLRRLASHPWFAPTALGASVRSAGQRYGDAVRWLLPGAIPPAVAGLPVTEADRAAEEADVDLALSALDAASAARLEPRLAARGIPVVTNASASRMDGDVPLVVPEVNPDHLELARGRAPGCILANPNCAAIGLVLALKPLVDAFGVERVAVTTLQAASGAGSPGVPALDLLGNVVPWIEGEEEKLEREPAKILGRLAGAAIEPAAIAVSAHTHRVPVVDGHLLAISVGLGRRARVEEVVAALAGFCAPEIARELPSSPARPLELLAGEAGPQPRFDVGRGGGMTVTVGRVRRCAVLDVRLVALVHNAERGAAGGTLLLAETALRAGLITPGSVCYAAPHIGS